MKKIGLALLGAALLLAGCAEVRMTMTRQHGAAGAPVPATFVVLPEEEGLRSTQNFRQLSQLVGQSLERHGYKPVARPEEAKLAVVLGWGMEGGPTTTVKVPLKDAGASGTTTISNLATFTGASTMPSKAPQMRIGDTGVANYTFKRQLTVNILDLGKLHSGQDRLFFGSVNSEGVNDNIQELFPTMVDALFDGFPGRNGETVTLSRSKK
jgi:hypothetical protein